MVILWGFGLAAADVFFFLPRLYFITSRNRPQCSSSDHFPVGGWESSCHSCHSCPTASSQDPIWKERTREREREEVARNIKHIICDCSLPPRLKQKAKLISPRVVSKYGDKLTFSLKNHACNIAMACSNRIRKKWTHESYVWPKSSLIVNSHLTVLNPLFTSSCGRYVLSKP